MILTKRIGYVVIADASLPSQWCCTERGCSLHVGISGDVTEDGGEPSVQVDTGDISKNSFGHGR
jgi:hypothetical protein